MNSKMRQLILERDGFRCVVCRGTCPYRGHGEEPCKLPSPKLARAVYFEVEKGYHKMSRLNAEHVDGKKREEWNETCAICPCCHRHKVQGGGPVYEAELAYLASVGPEPEEYRVAREQEAKDKPKRRAKLKAARKVYRKKGNERLEKTGKTRIMGRPPKRTAKSRFGRKKHTKEETSTRGLRLPSRVLEQMSRPVLNSFRP